MVKELLLQEAHRQNLVATPETDDKGRRETPDDASIRALLDREISVLTADETTCRRYYANNRRRFRSPDIFEAAHILVSAVPDDPVPYAAAVALAETMIAAVQQEPSAFERLAREHSTCPSDRNGGRLGQITKGQTVPEFETFLFNLEQGQLCPVPVKSRYGAHVMRLDRKIEGRTLPFEAVHKKIAGYLKLASWQKAVAQYIRILAGNSEIGGTEIAQEQSPLVQ